MWDARELANYYWSRPLIPFRNHTRDREERLWLVIPLMGRMLARRSDGNAATTTPWPRAGTCDPARQVARPGREIRVMHPTPTHAVEVVLERVA